MPTNTTPRRYTVDVDGDVAAYASKAKAVAAFQAAAVAGRTVHAYTPAGNTFAGYLAEQGPVEVVDGELRRVEVAATPIAAAGPLVAPSGATHHAGLFGDDRTRCGVAADRGRGWWTAPAGTYVSCRSCQRYGAATPAPVEVETPAAEQAADVAAARRTSTEQAPSHAAHVAELAAAGGPVADVELGDLADALRGTPRVDDYRAEAPVDLAGTLNSLARHGRVIPLNARRAFVKTPAGRLLVAEVVATAGARPTAPGRFRQLAIDPLTADEDGAQLDLFDAVAEATR